MYLEIVQHNQKNSEEANHAASGSGVLNDFVELIHGVAAEFVAMDSNIASNIDANTSNLPETSAALVRRRVCTKFGILCRIVEPMKRSIKRRKTL